MPLSLPLPPPPRPLRPLDTSAVDAIRRAAADTPWVVSRPHATQQVRSDRAGAADVAADFFRALADTYPSICARATADEASHVRRLRQLDATLAEEKRIIEAHVAAFWRTLDARHEVMVDGAARRATRQAEMDNVAAYLEQLLRVNATFTATEGRLRDAADAEVAGTTGGDHARRVAVDATALHGLIAERERLADTCPICHEPLRGGRGRDEPPARIRCRHRFHTRCLVEWAESCAASGRTPSCPLCRGTLATPVAAAGA